MNEKASRDKQMPRYDLIPRQSLARIAQVFEKGAEHYGVDNWKKGGDDFLCDCLNHARQHIMLHEEGDISEDHLAHAIVNLIFVMELNDNIDYKHLKKVLKWACQNCGIPLEVF